MDCNRILGRLCSHPLEDDDGWVRIHGEDVPNNLRSGIFRAERRQRAPEVIPTVTQ